MISLKLSSTQGQERITLSGETSFADFLDVVSRKTSIPVEKCQVSSGFPPEVIHGESEDMMSSFKLLASGSLVLVREGQPPSMKKSRRTGCRKISLLTSMGFSVQVSEQALEIAGDDMDLAIEVAQGITAANQTQTEVSNTAQAVSDSSKEKRQLTRRVIDADNSCLFNAIGFLMHRDKMKMGPVYRQVIANEILSNRETYNSDILGQSTEEYVKWILNPEKWGGEIEMNILSKHLQLEIAAVDVQTGKRYIYGEDGNYVSRIYLLYDGVHYDAITSALVKVDGCSNETDDITIFSPKDEAVIEQTEIMALGLREKKLFVNMAGCDLQCLICLKGLKGQKDAQAHAKSTGHQNFGQVNI